MFIKCLCLSQLPGLVIQHQFTDTQFFIDLYKGHHQWLYLPSGRSLNCDPDLWVFHEETLAFLSSPINGICLRYLSLHLMELLGVFLVL